VVTFRFLEIGFFVLCFYLAINVFRFYIWREELVTNYGIFRFIHIDHHYCDLSITWQLLKAYIQRARARGFDSCESDILRWELQC